jgi:uncharacterized membrane protein
MKNVWKISGWYLFAVGIIHTVVGIILFPGLLMDMAKVGILNSVGDDIERFAVFFFMFFGFLFLYMGLHWQELIRRHKEPLSKLAAWGMTVFVAAGTVMLPVSGFWIMMPLCLILLYPHYFGRKKPV